MKGRNDFFRLFDEKKNKKTKINTCKTENEQEN
jgi:hypothetical protein